MFCKYTDFPQIIQGIGRKVDGVADTNPRPAHSGWEIVATER